jgi:hypothetical protein
MQPRLSSNFELISFDTAGRYRSVLENQQLQSIPSQAINAIWTGERAKLTKKHQAEREQIDEKVKKIEIQERKTMNKQKALLKERFKLHRFSHMYKGETNYGFDEKEFLYYINKGVLRLRRHEMRAHEYRELSKSIDSKSRDSYRNRSQERSIDNSNNHYDYYDSHLSFSPQSNHRKPIIENSFSDSKYSKDAIHGHTGHLTNGYRGSNIIDWRDAVFVVPKQSRPGYLKKHVYDVNPSPVFSPDRSNRPRESSKEKATIVIKEWDRSRSPSRSRTPEGKVAATFRESIAKKDNSQKSSTKNFGTKSGALVPLVKEGSTKRSQENTESLIDIDFEEEDEIDPNTIDLNTEHPAMQIAKDGEQQLSAGKNGDELKVIPKIEPAFEVRDVLKAFHGLLASKIQKQKVQEPSNPAPRIEPAFETRDVLKAFSSLLRPKNTEPIQSPPKTEPAFETRDVLKAFGSLLKPKVLTEPLQSAPRVEPAFETRDVLRAFSGLLKPKTISSSSTAEPIQSPPRIEPVFETRDVLRAFSSLLKPKVSTSAPQSEPIQQAPRVEPAFETRDVLRALGNLLKPKATQSLTPAETQVSPPKTEPAFESRELFKALSSLVKPKLAPVPAETLPDGGQAFPIVVQKVNITNH